MEQNELRYIEWYLDEISRVVRALGEGAVAVVGLSDRLRWRGVSLRRPRSLDPCARPALQPRRRRERCGGTPPSRRARHSQKGAGCRIRLRHDGGGRGRTCAPDCGTSDGGDLPTMFRGQRGAVRAGEHRPVRFQKANSRPMRMGAAQRILTQGASRSSWPLFATVAQSCSSLQTSRRGRPAAAAPRAWPCGRRRRRTASGRCQPGPFRRAVQAADGGGCKPDP